MNFSKRLKQLRSESKLTQSEFAEKIKVARTTYAMYEQGNREPDYEILNRIADYYDVSVDYLIGRSENDNINDFEKFKNNPTLERWFKELPNSEEEDLEALKDMWEIIQRNKNK